MPMKARNTGLVISFLSELFALSSQIVNCDIVFICGANANRKVLLKKCPVIN